MRIRSSFLLVLLPLALSTCATSGPSVENPEACADIVARHQANPSLDVDVEPRARRMTTFKVPRGDYRVTFVVDETGQADPGSFTVTPTPPDIEEFRSAFVSPSYFPARVGDCAVPSLVTRRIGTEEATS